MPITKATDVTPEWAIECLRTIIDQIETGTPITRDLAAAVHRSVYDMGHAMAAASASVLMPTRDQRDDALRAHDIEFNVGSVRSRARDLAHDIRSPDTPKARQMDRATRARWMVSLKHLHAMCSHCGRFPTPRLLRDILAVASF